jgi:hypothetical protein
LLKFAPYSAFFEELSVIFLLRLPEIVYLSPRPPKADSELHQLARAGDAAALRAFLHTHGSEGIDEQNAGKWGGWSFNKIYCLNIYFLGIWSFHPLLCLLKMSCLVSL